MGFCRIMCLGSSSRGNCFVLEAKKEKIVLDLGVGFSQILKNIDYNIESVRGCLVTHL